MTIVQMYLTCIDWIIDKVVELSGIECILYGGLSGFIISAIILVLVNFDPVKWLFGFIGFIAIFSIVTFRRLLERQRNGEFKSTKRIDNFE